MAQTKVTSAAPSKRPAKTLAGFVPPATDLNRAQMIAHYQVAVELMQKRHYLKAHEAFERMLAAGPGDLADRIRTHISACMAQSNKEPLSFLTPEEQYDYAISQLNLGLYDDATQHLNAILEKHKNADYAFYGLAVLASMTGDSNTCLEHLTEAIRQNPRNRIQARADSDFQDMADDPRFTELLYPEI